MTLREDLQTLSEIGQAKPFTMEWIREQLYAHVDFHQCADRNGGIYCAEIRKVPYDLDIYLDNNQFKLVFTFRYGVLPDVREYGQNYLYDMRDLTPQAEEMVKRWILAIRLMATNAWLRSVLRTISYPSIPEDCRTGRKVWVINHRMEVVACDAIFYDPRSPRRLKNGTEKQLPNGRWALSEADAIQDAIKRCEEKRQDIMDKFEAKLSKWKSRQDLLRARLDSVRGV